MSNECPVSKEDSRTGKDGRALFVGTDVILAQLDSCPLLLVHSALLFTLLGISEGLLI